MDERTAHLLVSIAELYYLQDRTQAEVAQALKISRPHVSRLLERARREGIVTISVRSPFEGSAALSKELRKLFPLREIAIAPSGRDALKHVAEAAGQLLASWIRRVSVVGVSWGRAVRMVVDEVPGDPRRNVEVVPLVGGMGLVGDEIHANEIARRLASRLGGKYYVLNAPAMAESASARATLIQEGGVASILERARKVDVAVVGIGSVGSGSTLVRSGYLRPDHVRDLQAAGAVGDICSRFYCRDGSPCRSHLAKRVIGIELKDLRELPWVVGVAAGVEKAPAILGALRGGHINALVADEAAVRAILRLASARSVRA